MASSSKASAGQALAPEPVPLAVGTKRPREAARKMETALAPGLEAWAAQAAPTPGRPADVPLVGQQSAQPEERAASRSVGGASTSKPTPPTAGGVVEISNVAAPSSVPLAATLPSGTHTSLGASPRPSKRGTRCFRYGNYHRYYGYRVGETLEDHRVAHFRDEWFAGKRVLDIGCNEGLVGMSIAVRCKPAKMLGVDIDPHLVKKAKKKLARLKRAAERQTRARKQSTIARDARERDEDTSADDPSVVVDDEATKRPERGGARDDGSRETETLDDASRPGTNDAPSATLHLADAADALNAVSFLHRNVAAPEADEARAALFARGSFDAVLCLSVTKWIQLNWGDEGLKRLFADVHESLSPGGVFIVEPQPWRSYGRAFRKQTMPEETKAHFRAITLRPSLYAEFLRTTVGFERVVALRDADAHDASEFDRAVLLCVKRSSP